MGDDGLMIPDRAVPLRMPAVAADDAPTPSAAPVLAAVASILLLTAAGWGALLFEASRAGDGADPLWTALCTATGLVGTDAGPAGYAIKAGLWAAMTVAMMLPTASAAALGYAARVGEGAGGAFAPLMLLLGYLVVWIGAALGLAAMQIGLDRALDLFVLPDKAAAVIAGTAVGFAGLHQFSAVKLRRLAACRLPIGGDLPRGDARGAFGLGLRYGASCVGCCGPMMGMMVVSGAMNLVWTAVFAALMTAERLSSGLAVVRVIGALLIVAGVALATSSVGPSAIAAHFLR